MSKPKEGLSIPDHLEQADVQAARLRAARDKLSGMSGKTTGAEADKLGEDYDRADALEKWHTEQATRKFRGENRSGRLLQTARAVLARFQWRQ